MQTTKVSSQVQQAPVFTEVNDGYPPVGALRTIGFRTFRPTKLPVRRV